MSKRRIILGTLTVFFGVLAASVLVVNLRREPILPPPPITITGEDVNRLTDSLPRPDADLHAVDTLLKRMAASPDAGHSFYCTEFEDVLGSGKLGRWRAVHLRHLISALVAHGKSAAEHDDSARAIHAWQLAVDATLLPVNTLPPQWLTTEGVRIHGSGARIHAVFPNDVLLDELDRALTPLAARPPQNAKRLRPVMDQINRMKTQRRAWGTTITPVLDRAVKRSESPLTMARVYLTKEDPRDLDQERLAEERIRTLRMELPELRRLIGESLGHHPQDTRTLVR